MAYDVMKNPENRVILFGFENQLKAYFLRIYYE